MTNDAYNRKLTTYTDNIPDASQVIFRNLLCSFFSGFPCVRGKQVALITYGFNAVGLGGAVLQFFFAGEKSPHQRYDPFRRNLRRADFSAMHPGP